VALVGLGFDAADFFGSNALAYIAWAVAGLWAVYLASSRFREWWPFALASTVSSLRRKLLEAERDAQRLESVNRRVKQANEELTQRLDERKRQRIDGWREFFDNFDYANDNVLVTAVYSDIRPFLKDEIVERFENPREVHVELDTRGGRDVVVRGQTPSSVKTLLLDEVTRIEREEWERL
jgi:hypothetical protein